MVLHYFLEFSGIAQKYGLECLVVFDDYISTMLFKQRQLRISKRHSYMMLKRCLLRISKWHPKDAKTMLVKNILNHIYTVLTGCLLRISLRHPYDVKTTSYIASRCNFKGIPPIVLNGCTKDVEYVIFIRMSSFQHCFDLLPYLLGHIRHIV